MNKIIGLSLVNVLLLSGCGGGSGGGSSSGGSSISSSAQVSIDAMTSVPVINGSATQGTLYVHNYGAADAMGVSFNLGSATAKTKLKSALAKVGLNLGSYEDSNGFVLINPERCASISAGGSCAVNFTTPSMSLGNLGNSLVKLSYNSGNVSRTTSQVVNYNYVNLAALSGVNFTGSLNVTGVQGSMQHVVGYVYGGGTDTVYQNVNLNSTNETTSISNGFINGQEVAAGQVVAVEFAVALQNNKTSSVNITPTWGGSKLQSASVSVSGSGVPLALNVTPSQATVNYIFGNIPVLTAPSTSTAIINVVNNGNANSSGGLTAVATGGNAGDLNITNSCSSILAANAGNSCQISFTTSSYASGTTTVQYKANNVVVGSQTVIWTNDQPFPAVYLAPTPENISFGKGGISTSVSSIVFNITNVGKAPLAGVTYPVTNTGAAPWSQDTSNCLSTLGVGATCSITGHLTGNDDGVGKLYIRAVGNFNGTSYSFVGLPLNYLVSANPSLEIMPNTSSMTLLANNFDIQTKTYTVKNIGNDPALFTGLALQTPGSAAVKPVVVGGSCNSGITLTENTTCTVIVQYGPAAVNLAANESGVATLQIDYHGGTPDVNRNAKVNLNYNLVGNDSYAQQSTSANLTLNGSGTSSDPYTGNATLNPMKLTLTYRNPSINYPMTNFNLNTNNLPYGLVVDPSSNCATGSLVMSLESNGGSCLLVLALNRNLLTTVASPQLNFTTPTASWTTPLGFYSQVGTLTYLNYSQPTITSVLSNNNSNFASTVLTITGSNLSSGGGSMTANVSEVKNWLETAPANNPGSNCTVNSGTYAVSCPLTTASNVQSVIYTMPNYMQIGEVANIPLVFTTTTGTYAYLNPLYTFINYIKN